MRMGKEYLPFWAKVVTLIVIQLTASSLNIWAEISPVFLNKTITPTFTATPARKPFLVNAVSDPTPTGTPTYTATPVPHCYVESNYIGIYVNKTTDAMVLGTSSTYPVSNACLMYGYVGNASYAGSSHLVFNIDGTAVDFSTAQESNVEPTASGTGLGAVISCSRTTSNQLVLGAQYTIVNNVCVGLNPDMVQIKFSVTNNGTVTHLVGCRYEIDTKVIKNDATNISIDNGASVFATNTVWRATNSMIPANWWDYDAAPPAPATLVGRGSVYNNPLGVPATKPDVLEVAYWGDTESSGQWTVASSGSSITDSSVVLWWTGSGSETIVSQSVAPGQVKEWVTYYGFNEGTLLSPTPTWNAAVTATATEQVVATSTAQAKQTATEVARESQTRTFTSSPSATPTWTCTLTITPTSTVTPSEPWSGLGKTVLAPVPVPRNGNLTLHSDRPLYSSQWDIYDLIGESVDHAYFGPGTQAFWVTTGVPPGLYAIRLKLVYLDKVEDTIWQKVLLSK